MNNLDSQKTLQKHKQIINQKPLLKKIYIDFYKQLKNIKFHKGKIFELGSGAGFIKEIMPKVITSDVLRGAGIDIVFSAEKIPLGNSSVAGFTMIDVFHHIKNPEKALKEMQRCLKRGGKIVMIEPYNSICGRFIYQNFHHENFDPKAGWKIRGKGRLSHANGAIPWIMFIRDRELFGKKFPNLKIKKISPHTPLLYLLSGGLSKPQLVPDFFYKSIKSFENSLGFFNKYLGMFITIELEKI